MKNKTRHTLNKKSELLLLRHLDGECRGFEKRRVRKLLESNPQAEIFLKKQMQISTETTNSFRNSNQRQTPIDLWDRISNRIDQEERSQLFLGKRKLTENPLSIREILNGLFGSYRAMSVSGLATAVAIALVVWIPTFKDSQPSALRPALLTQSKINHTSLKFVSRASRGAALQHRTPRYARPRILREFNSPVELDWMQSDGHVRMINAPGDKAPIIWVQRQSSSRMPHNIRKNKESTDENRVVIIEHRAPKALLVGE